ncbi:hypothetical protein INR49_021606, partial [Caranx melampygus]
MMRVHSFLLFDGGGMSFSDSCFLSSPLCSELADVQWYGHDKAKPGTLRSTVALSYCLSTVPHCYPSTTNNLILKALQKPCPDRTGGLDMSLPPPPCILPLFHLTTSLLCPLYHSSPCSITEPFSSLILRSTQATGTWGGRSDGKREHRKKYQTHNSHWPFQDQFHISSLPPPPTLPPTLRSPVHCHPIRGYLLDLSHQFETHFQAQTNCVGFHYSHFYVHNSLFGRMVDYEQYLSQSMEDEVEGSDIVTTLQVLQNDQLLLCH